MKQRCAITIAVGNVFYLKLAENLLLSFLLWNKGNDIEFLLVTDNSAFFNKYDGLEKITVRQIALDETDKSFTSKFKLFEHANAQENLFIDCDCLVYQGLDMVFDKFKGKSFSAIGNNITTGNFFGDVNVLLNKFNLASLPKFVGSVYYFKNNTTAKKIFEAAIELKKDYDNLGFARLQNKENEEPLFAVAMALNGETLLPNDGAIKADFMYYKHIKANVLKGTVEAHTPIADITGGEFIPAVAHPAILHFNGSFSGSYQYKAEVYRLKFADSPAYLLDTLAFFKFGLPFKTKSTVKNNLRPLYHLFFGNRKVKKSEKVNDPV